MRVVVGLLVCVFAGGIIGLLIGKEGAQTIGVLLALAAIVAMAVLPTRKL